MVHFDSGLSVLAQNLSPDTSVLQGGDHVNFTLRFVYNTTQHNFSVADSPGCNSLTQGELYVRALLTLPIVFHLVSNISQHSQRIITNVSSCGSKRPEFVVNSDQNKGHDLSSYDIELNITAPNVSWTLDINFVALVSELVLPDAELNISANITDITSTSRTFVIAEYSAPIPTIQRLFVIGTSVPQTASVNLTSSEEITFQILFNIPRITSDMKLLVVLPKFQNSTALQFLSGSVVNFSNGVVGQNLQVGQPVTFRASNSSSSHFSLFQDISEINFKGLSSSVQNLSNSVVTLQYTAIVVELRKGGFASQSQGNISFCLEYKTPKGKEVIQGHVTQLWLDEPLVIHSLFIDDPKLHYEGKSLEKFNFIVHNPKSATRPALNVTISTKFSPSGITVLNKLIQLCNMSSYNKVHCFNISNADVVSDDDGVVVAIER